MHDRLILQPDGVPFKDADEAQYIAAILTGETGLHYNAVTCDGGFAIQRPSSTVISNDVQSAFGEIYLRPAWRSMIWSMMMIILILYSVVHAETILIVTKMDMVRSVIHDLFGFTFSWPRLLIATRLVLLLILVVVVAKMLFRKYGQRFYIGPKGIESNIGIISRNQTRIEYKHIRGVNLRQTVFERLLNVGDIVISTSSGQDEVKLDDIARPGQMLSELRERLRSMA